MSGLRTVIKASGIYVPNKVADTEHFKDSQFYTPKGDKIEKDYRDIGAKLTEISGIKTRRYEDDESKSTSDAATEAAINLFANHPEIDPQKLRYIFVAHNFGDVAPGSTRSDLMPSVSARVKRNLNITNPRCMPVDSIFGCPGWLQGLIMADQMLLEGEQALVIGAELLSRVVDPHDLDSMLFGDGAGAVVVQKEQNAESGLLYHDAFCHSESTSHFLINGESKNPDFAGKTDDKFIQMLGRRVYEYAITYVPQLVIEALERTNTKLEDIDHFILHQANQKINETIVKKVSEHFGMPYKEGELPLTLTEFGNTSVASIPGLYHRMLEGKHGEKHQIKKGQTILFGSVGAGMYCNVGIYKQ